MVDIEKENSVRENIVYAIKLLNDNYENFQKVADGVSTCDKKQDYWLHYIENYSLNTKQRYKIVSEIKKIRNIRRQFKNDMEILKLFKDNESRMQNNGSRQILLADIYKTMKKQDNPTYNNDIYTDLEIDNILGIKQIIEGE